MITNHVAICNIIEEVQSNNAADIPSLQLELTALHIKFGTSLCLFMILAHVIYDISVCHE